MQVRLHHARRDTQDHGISCSLEIIDSVHKSLIEPLIRNVTVVKDLLTCMLFGREDRDHARNILRSWDGINSFAMHRMHNEEDGVRYCQDHVVLGAEESNRSVIGKQWV
jgi:hypothetical protein